MYCRPSPDGCPEYNAWLKDELPVSPQVVAQIPTHLIRNFTLNYRISYAMENIKFRPGNTALFKTKWTIEYLESLRRQVRARRPYGTYNTLDLYPVLERYASIAIKHKRCAVIGTAIPWIEAALLEFNASNITTIEYLPIISSVPKLNVMTPTKFAQLHKQGRLYDQNNLLDSVWSYSSIEHDGLGRYADPLNPYGDLQTMAKITCILKPGGFFFLALPTNAHDFLEFNLHRIYGPIRYPLIYRYYHVVEVFLGSLSNDYRSYIQQPIFVLQNKVGCLHS